MPHSHDTSLKIAQKAVLIPIEKVARKIGIQEKFLDLYGPYKAKIKYDQMNLGRGKSKGKYIFVTAITPTTLGEGKTVTTIGLSMALNKMNKKACACIRQPALGPLFGIKGAGTGGGHSQAVPMEDINLHFTGDTHAVSIAHNLLSSYIDNSLYGGNPLGIDPSTISWNRVIDLNDRFLRNISIGMGAKIDGISRRSGFDITGASEVMAILALSESIEDLRARLGKIIIGYTTKQKPVTADDVKAAGAMSVILKEALKPNLVQTIEGTPCFIHTGPFANIAHGNNSIIADRIALKFCDYVITEGGFGADLGGEKFFNIKCRKSGLAPDMAIIVCSIRALKMHSGDFEIKGSKPLDNILFRENISAVERGASNLDKQIENIKYHGVPVMVCINQFATDTEKEINAVKKCALAQGAEACVASRVWQEGSMGGQELAKAVIDMLKVKRKPSFRFLYPTDLPIKEKINRIAKTIYGAKEIQYSEDAESKIKFYHKMKLDDFPVCMAKTQLSLSHDPKRKGRPRNFKLPVNDVQLANGAGFIKVMCGEVKTMPALPKVPVGTKMDIDKNGNIVGLF